jgi:hypothetical protein
MTAKEMKQHWNLVDGDKEIGRNHISETDGINAIAFCEDMVIRMYVDDGAYKPLR